MLSRRVRHSGPFTHTYTHTYTHTHTHTHTHTNKKHMPSYTHSHRLQPRTSLHVRCPVRCNQQTQIYLHKKPMASDQWVKQQEHIAKAVNVFTKTHHQPRAHTSTHTAYTLHTEAHTSTHTAYTLHTEAHRSTHKHTQAHTLHTHCTHKHTQAHTHTSTHAHTCIHTARTHAHTHTRTHTQAEANTSTKRQGGSSMCRCFTRMVQPSRFYPEAVPQLLRKMTHHFYKQKKKLSQEQLVRVVQL